MATAASLGLSGAKSAGLRVITEANAPAARARLSIAPLGGPSSFQSGNVRPSAPLDTAVQPRSLRSDALGIVSRIALASVFSTSIHPLSLVAERIASPANASAAEGCVPRPAFSASNDVPYRST